MHFNPFDSRNKRYKTHIGAVAAETPLRLRLLLHNDAKVHNVFLVVNKDGEECHEIVMMPAEHDGEYRFYECEITLSTGLYWYFFKYESDFGTMLVTKGDNSLGIISDSGGKWQQTVYDKSFKTPDWLKGGIIYQIFPDRFFKSGKQHKDIPPDRFIQNDWYAQPAYLQNDEKRQLGNDYYGGDLEGIRKKLSYLKELGVSCIYLNPIFEAHSNHRYNTADYMKIDPSLGNRRDLKKLCTDAKKLGISVILDGVFSHTGDDSIYFNKKGRYKETGAWQSESSPYRSWFNFKSWPDDYSCWWGVPSLPETVENDDGFSEFITGKNGVIEHWSKCGIDGWRLDVADELPDEFLDKIRQAVKRANPNAYLLGEVWEDATNKISYSHRRRFLLGNQLDSVMNYPFADAITDFVKGGNADRLCETVMSVCENYPPPALHTLMNHIGSHDTARILTRLGTDENGDRAWQAERNLSEEEYSLAKRRLAVAATLQFTLPGVPSIYYGDEAGMQGYGDPFCRGGYPWDREDGEILEFYRSLGKIRRECSAFCEGDFVPFVCRLGLFSFERICESEPVFVAVNRWQEEEILTLPEEYKNGEVLLGNVSGGNIILPPFGAAIIKKV